MARGAAGDKYTVEKLADGSVTGWEFVALGEVQPYEQTENYRKRKIVDRFTPEML